MKVAVRQPEEVRHVQCVTENQGNADLHADDARIFGCRKPAHTRKDPVRF